MSYDEHRPSPADVERWKGDPQIVDARVHEVMAEVERAVQEFFARDHEQVEGEWRAFGEREAERLNAMSFDDQLRVFAMTHGVSEIDVEKWKESVAGMHWTFKPADGENLASLVVDVRLKRPIEQVYMTVTISVRDPEIAFSRIRGWHMPCTAEDCGWYWALRSERDSEEIERGREMHRAHHENDHPLEVDDL